MNKEEAIKQLKKHKQEIDKQYISSRYSKAIEVALNLIQKQENKIASKDKEIKLLKEFHNENVKIIDKMAEYIKELDIDEDICTKNVINPQLCNEEYSNCKECIKEYYKKEVENEI